MFLFRQDVYVISPQTPLQLLRIGIRQEHLHSPKQIFPYSNAISEAFYSIRIYWVSTKVAKTGWIGKGWGQRVSY